MDQVQPLSVQLLMFYADDTDESFLDAICASVTQHFSSDTGWSATSAAVRPEGGDRECGSRNPYVRFTLSHRALPHSFDVTNRQKTASVISALCDAICNPESSLSLVQITGGADVLFMPRHPPLSLHDEDLMRHFVIASLSYSQNDQAEFENPQRDWHLAMKAAIGEFLRLGIWGISQLEYYKLFDEVFDAIRQGTSSDQVQNVEVLLKLGKAGGVLAPTTLPRLQALADTLTSEIDEMDGRLSESRDNLVAAVERIRLSLGYVNGEDGHTSISVKAIDESLQAIWDAIPQAEDTLAFAKKDVIHKRTMSRVMGCITSAGLVATAALFLASSPSGLLLAGRMLGAGGTLVGVGTTVSTHIRGNNAHKLHTTVERILKDCRGIWANLAVVLMRNTSRDAEDNARLLERSKRIGANLEEAYMLEKWGFGSSNEQTRMILKSIHLASESIKASKQSVLADQPSPFK